MFFVAALLITGCKSNQKAEEHDEHEQIKLQFTAYSDFLEVFAEADPLVAGEESNILSHFSVLPRFTPLEKAAVTIRLVINGNKTEQMLDKPVKKGIYSFSLKPGNAGKGTIEYDIVTDSASFKLIVPDITVYATDEEAHESAESSQPSKANTVVFTKEQSWKTDFATGKPESVSLGQIIKTTAQIRSSRSDESLVTAKSEGVVNIAGNSITEGKNVQKGQLLVSVSGGGFAGNNMGVRYAEARSNFDKAKADYERAELLAKDRIVSEKELLNARNQFENARSVYDNMRENFSASGQTVFSPVNGYIKQLFVKNGQYVEAGTPLVLISQNRNLVVYGEVRQKYADMLANLSNAYIKANDKTYTLQELNGKILASGRTVTSDNYLIPVSLQIDNKGSFLPGSFVELYLESKSGNNCISLPNTALIEEQGNYFVYVQVTPELFEKREVTPGRTNGIQTEIISGIGCDERVVIKGGLIIKLSQSTGSLDAHSGHVH